MKKIALIIFAVILCSFTVSINNSQITNALTSGKWFVESVQESGAEPEMVENKNDEWIIFYKDGKVEEGLYDKVTKSVWEYSEKDKAIKVTGADIVYKKIIEISDSKLTIELIEDVNADDNVIVNYVK